MAVLADAEAGAARQDEVQLLVAGRASYILNSISAYRTAQKDQPEVGADIFFRSPLVGPGGEEAAQAVARGSSAQT